MIAQSGDVPIGALNLRLRARKCLFRMGVETVGQLLTKTDADLLGARNFGVTSLNEVKDKLESMGLRLGMDAPCHFFGTAEERLAWDRYAASCCVAADGENHAAQVSASFADALLTERRKRFGVH